MWLVEVVSLEVQEEFSEGNEKQKSSRTRNQCQNSKILKHLYYELKIMLFF